MPGTRGAPTAPPSTTLSREAPPVGENEIRVKPVSFEVLSGDPLEIHLRVFSGP
jgi:hypothetical protein